MTPWLRGMATGGFQCVTSVKVVGDDTAGRPEPWSRGDALSANRYVECCELQDGEDMVSLQFVVAGHPPRSAQIRALASNESTV